MRLKGKLVILPLLLATWSFSSPALCLPWTEDVSLELNEASPAHENVVQLLRAEKFSEAKNVASLLVGENPVNFSAHLLLLLSLLGNEDFSAIQAHLREVDTVVPQYSAALKENVFQVLFNERRYYRAMNVIADLKDEQRSAQLDGMIGRLFLAQSHYKKAEVSFRTALQKDKSLHDVRYDLGRASLAQGQYTPAIAELRRIPEASAPPEALNQLLGALYVSVGNYELALKTFKKILTVRPNDVLANLNIGLIHLVLGNDDEALVNLRRSQKSDMTTDSIAAEILVLTRSERNSEIATLVESLSAEQLSDPIVQFAIIANDNNSLSNQSLSAIARVFPDAMSLSDGDINLFHSNSRNIAITSLLYKQGFYLAVEETYKKAEKEPRHPFFVLNYARSLVKMGEMDKATEVYEKLSERHPTLTSPKIELAELLYHEGDVPAAIKFYREAVAVNKVTGLQSELLMQLGNLYNADDKPARAIEQYNAAYEISPDARLVNQIAATYSEKLNQHDLAIRFLSKVDDHHKFPPMFDTLGWAYFKKGDTDKAVAAYEKLLAATGNQQSPQTFSRIAQVYEKAENSRNSRIYYELALNTGHEFEDEQLAKKRLTVLDSDIGS